LAGSGFSSPSSAPWASPRCSTASCSPTTRHNPAPPQKVAVSPADAVGGPTPERPSGAQPPVASTAPTVPPPAPEAPAPTRLGAPPPRPSEAAAEGGPVPPHASPEARYAEVAFDGPQVEEPGGEPEPLPAPDAAPERFLRSASPIRIESFGPFLDDPGEFLVCVGGGARVTVRIVDGSGQPVSGVEVTVNLSEEISFSPTPGDRSRTQLTGSDGTTAFDLFFVAASPTARHAEIETVVPPDVVFLGDPLVQGTVVAVEEPPTLEVVPDPVTGETALHPGDAVIYTVRTQPPGFEAGTAWTFDRVDGAPFLLGVLAVGRDQVAVAFITPGEYTVNAACEVADPGQTIPTAVAPHEVTFAAPSSETAAEAPEDLDVRLVGGRLLVDPLTVDVVDAGSGTATAGEDYEDFGRQSVVLQPDATFGQTAPFTLPVLADDDAPDVEPDETVALALADPTPGLAVLGAPAEHTAAIRDDDASVAFVTPVGDPLAEDADPSTRAVLLRAETFTGRPLLRDVTVDLLTGGTATVAEDYLLSATAVTFPAGSPSGADGDRAVTVQVIDDLLAEGPEEAELLLVNRTRASPRAPLTHLLPLEDDDAGALGFVRAESQAAEPDDAVADPDPVVHPVEVGLTLPEGVTLARDVAVDVVAAGGTAGSDDVAPSTQTLVFPVAAGAGVQTAELEVLADRRVEGDETRLLALETPVASPAAPEGTTEHTVTVVDDDRAEVRFAAESSRAAEGTTAAVAVELVLDAGESLAIALGPRVTDAGGSATPGEDFVPVDATPVFPPGAPSGSRVDVAVELLNDAAAEPDEAVILALARPAPDDPLDPVAPTAHELVIEDVPVPRPDFFLITPKPGVLGAGEVREFRAVGFRFREDGPQDAPPSRLLDPDDPEDRAVLDARFDRVGPVPVEWALEPPPGTPGGGPGGEGRAGDVRPTRPDVAFVATPTTAVAAVLVDAGDRPGRLHPGLVAVEPRTGVDDSADLLVLELAFELIDPEGGVDGDPDERDASGIDLDSVEIELNARPVAADRLEAEDVLDEATGLVLGKRLRFSPTSSEVEAEGDNVLAVRARDVADNALPEDESELVYLLAELVPGGLPKAFDPNEASDPGPPAGGGPPAPGPAGAGSGQGGGR